MKSNRQLRAACAVAIVAAVVAPAAASAHPSVFGVTAKVAVPNTTPVQLTDETQYVITNHGFTYVVKESNGATTKGVMNYKLLPGAYRNQPGFTKTQQLAEGDTGAQAHATCRGVAALDAQEAILAWQETDPFYNYVPFQTTSAGLEDDPADWLAVIKARTGVDLTTVSDVPAACTALGGTYTPPDATVTTAAALAAGTVGEAVEPLNEQIDELEAAKAAAEQAAAAAAAAAKAATEKANAAEGAATAARSEMEGLRRQVTRLRGALKPVRLKLATRRVRAKSLAAQGVAVQASGPAGRKLTLRLKVDAPRNLKAATLATRSVRIGRGGRARVSLKPRKAAAAILARMDGMVSVTITATSPRPSIR